MSSKVTRSPLYFLSAPTPRLQQANSTKPGGPTAGADPFFDAKKFLEEERIQKEKERLEREKISEYFHTKQRKLQYKKLKEEFE